MRSLRGTWMGRFVGLLVGGLVMVGIAGPAAEGTATRPAGEKIRDAESQISGLAATGKFGEIDRLLRQAIESSPDNRVLQKLNQWVGDWQKLAGKRDNLRRTLLDAHVGFARKMAQARIWDWALKGALDAANIADDPAEVRQADWVKPIIDTQVERARQAYDEGKWYRAYHIYANLNDFHDDERFKDEVERCRGRARLTAIYRPDDRGRQQGDKPGAVPDEPAWQRQLMNIDDTLVAEVFRQIDSDYVEVPDFRKLTVGGLKALSLLATTPQLGKVITELKGSFPATRPATTTQPAEAVDDQRMRRRMEFVSGVEELIDACKNAPTVTRDDATDRFHEALLLNRRTIGLDDRLITYEFLSAAMDQLDPYSAVIWPKQVEDFGRSIRGIFAGVGIQIRKDAKTKWLTVVTPLEDTPAYEAGIEPDDLIVAIESDVDGRLEKKDTRDIPLDDAVKRITGPPGTTVKLTVQRTTPDADKKPVARRRDFTLTRAQVVVQTVKGYRRPVIEGGWDYMIDPQEKIGYVRVTDFKEKTMEDFRKVIKTLFRQGMRGLILDLRDNPGGLLQAAVEMGRLFIDKGDIVSTESRSKDADDEDPDVIQGNGKALPPFPMALLVNEHSASASEIVAGALQDHHRAVIVGERSFGKASVQRVYKMLREACLLKLTTAHYKVPSGKNIHRLPGAKDWGISPSATVKVLPAEESSIFKATLARDVVHTKPRDWAGWQLVEAASDPESILAKPGAGPAAGDGDGDDPMQSTDAEESESYTDEQSKLLKDSLSELIKLLNSVEAEDAQLQAALLVVRSELAQKETADAQAKQARAAAVIPG